MDISGQLAGPFRSGDWRVSGSIPCVRTLSLFPLQKKLLHILPFYPDV